MMRGEYSEEVWAASFSPDGSMLAAGCHSGHIRVWDTQREEQIASLEGHWGYAGALAFSSDSALLASGSYDGTIKLWEMGSFRLLRTFVGYHQDIDTAKPFSLLSFNKKHSNGSGEINAVEFSPNGKALAYGTSYEKSGRHGMLVRILDLPTGETTKEIKCEFDVQKSWTTPNVLTFLDNRTLAVGCSSHVVVKTEGLGSTWTVNKPIIILYDIESGEESAEIKGAGREVFGLCISSNSRTLAAGAEDGTITLWNSCTRRRIKQVRIHSDSVDCIEFMGDTGLVVSGGWDQTVRVWESRTGTQIASMPCSDRVVAIWCDPVRPEILVADAGGQSHLPNIHWLELVTPKISVSTRSEALSAIDRDS